MTLPPALRKIALTAHITFSLGWLGAVAAYLALAIAGLTSVDAQKVRAAYLAMELIAWFVVVPFCVASLLSGLVQSLATEWGLFKHYWIVAKFLLAVAATIVLLLHLPAISSMAEVAGGASLAPSEFRTPRIQLILHAAGGLVVLLIAAILSVFKPWGKTPYGRRTESEGPTRFSWPLIGVFALVGLVLLFIALHLAGGGMRH